MTYPSQPRQPYQRPPTQQSNYGAAPESQSQRRGLPALAVVGIATGALIVGCLGGLVMANLNPDEVPAAAESPIETTPTAASTTPAREVDALTPEAPSSTALATLVVPDGLVGQNAAVAEDELRRAGFENIRFGSADADDTVVVLPANWTVVEVAPEPGTEVAADAAVVLTCTKQ